MREKSLLQLTRELRFGLHAEETRVPSAGANGFAGNPALLGSAIAPFLTLTATLSGAVDPRTGMLINIKIVDRVLREHAVPAVRAACYESGKAPAALMGELMAGLGERFEPYVLKRLTLAVSPYLSFSIAKEDPAMVSVSQRFEFSAAHRLHSEHLSPEENREVFGRCNNPNGHGHNYELEVTVAGPVGINGQVMAIEELQRVVNERVVEVFDHKHLNVDCAEFAGLNPTVENIAAVIFEKLKGAMAAPAKVARIRVWETPKTFCEISG
jgi:6-pyruvoyltetrahydropterin/6-carboxytetrahydropterin synthase